MGHLGEIGAFAAEAVAVGGGTVAEEVDPSGHHRTPPGGEVML
jgi:hypothetical protein